jgi:hypothetical protein
MAHVPHKGEQVVCWQFRCYHKRRNRYSVVKEGKNLGHFPIEKKGTFVQSVLDIARSQSEGEVFNISILRT